MHAFLTLTPEKARLQADEADRALQAWRKDPDLQLPALLGLPIAVKDVLCVADVRCTCGSRILESFVPPYSATAVRRLQEAGVVILGKTNTYEFAMGSSTENSAYGPTHYPWDLEHVPGGSSGGSAAAVAARLVPRQIRLGGRTPAKYCTRPGCVNSTLPQDHFPRMESLGKPGRRVALQAADPEQRPEEVLGEASAYWPGSCS